MKPRGAQNLRHDHAVLRSLGLVRSILLSEFILKLPPQRVIGGGLNDLPFGVTASLENKRQVVSMSIMEQIFLLTL